MQRLKIYRGVWHAVWREDGGTKRRSLHTTDRASAELRFREVPVLADATTVNGIYTAYCAEKGTERSVNAWKHLARDFAARAPEQVTRAVCRAYMERRRKMPKTTDGTIHTELTYLRAALRWHDSGTPAKFQFPPRPSPRSDYLTRDQYDALLAAATVAHIRLFIVLALATAARATALLELTWDRVDFERKQIQLGDGVRRRKGRALVPMTEACSQALLTAVKVRSSAHVIEFGGKPILRIVKGFRTIAAKAGMPWCSPHVLRHTAAVWMAEGGTPMAEISQFMGHTDIGVTARVYARFSPDYLRGAARHLETGAV